MEAHAQHLLEGLMARGHRVSVITTALPAEPALGELKPNGRLLTVGSKSGAYSSEWFWKLNRQVRELYKENPFEVLHAQGFAGLPLEFFAGLPGNVSMVHTIHGTMFSETALFPERFAKMNISERGKACWRYKHRLAAWPVWELFLRRARHLITDSEFTAGLVRRPSNRVRVVPLGVPFSSEPLGNEFDPFALIWVGRMEREKNPEFALQVLGALPERYTLHLVGEGPERERLERLMMEKELGSRVCWEGRLNATDLEELRSRCGVLLNPDGGHPAFGLVNAEALCAGLAVVATPHGAHPEIVSTKEDGALLGLGDARAWARALEGICREETVEKRLRRAERNRLRFALERMVLGVEEFYNELRKGQK
jgi:glycosyltransferase involved in cell wall biosynthesis